MNLLMQTPFFQSRLIDSSQEPPFDILGPVVQFLVDPAATSDAFGVIRGIIAPGVVVPLHSHADPEVIYVLDGALEFLRNEGDLHHWLTARPADVICIPSEVKHALRNNSSQAATALAVTTPNIYRFFRELAKPFDPDQPTGAPTPEDIQRLLTLSAKYNYWIASPEENAAIGLDGLFSAGVQK